MAGKEDDIILCVQYRPPMRSYCVEFPAGLIDKNETPEQAAIRELKEECGYIGKVTHVSPILGMEVGLTNANCKLVTVEVDASSDENQNPRQNLEDGEQITIVLVPVSKLMDHLLRFSSNEFHYYVDAKVWTFAQGLQFMNNC